MSKTIRGRVWRFGSNITTDDILPGRYLDRSGKEAGKFTMSGIDEQFASKVQPGDVIVAGENFGMGSGRENAPASLKYAGISAVIAPSFSRLFYRNFINMGMPALVCEDCNDIAAGDWVTIDIQNRTILHEKTNRTISIANMTGTSKAIWEAGGLVPFIKQQNNHEKTNQPNS